MLKLGIRAKLFLGSLALIVISLLPAHALLGRKLEADVRSRFEAELFVRLALITRQTEIALARPDPLDWDGLADELGERADGRVTFIAASGEVLGDSEVSRAALPQVENHGTRPEVVAALATGRGLDTRRSATVETLLTYIAVPIRRGAEVFGVARLAVPLPEVQEALSGLRRALLVSLLLALALAAGVSILGASWVGREIRALTDAARRMADGDLALRVGPGGKDELAELGRALDQLASSLSSTLAALRAERDLLGGVLDAMREGVLVVDDQGRIALVNAALREMLLLGSDVVGRTPLDLVRNADLAGLLDRARTGEAATELETGDLRPRRLMVKGTPLAGGGVLAVLVDVTDIRRLETVRRDFVANVSHELRTPVAAVAAATETLRAAAIQDPGAVTEFVDMIERNVQRLQRLLEDLLELSRIESRELKLKVQPVNLEGAVRHVLSLCDHRAAPKRIHLITDISPEIGAVNTDPRALEQILTNLVENAVKYCPERARVTVRARHTDGWLRISVEDTGPGIEARHLPRLFERFYRVDAGRARDVGGTGLGLSIVKNLVEAMGGRVTVESIVGQGSTFTFTIPTAV